MRIDISDSDSCGLVSDGMALLPDLEAKHEDLFIHFLNAPGVFAKLQGIVLL